MKSKSGNFTFDLWGNEEITSRFTVRNGERRMGEDLIETQKSTYVIIGVAESIGPRANYGAPGAEHGFEAFCKKFLAMQSNETLCGELVAIAGKIEVSDNLNESIDLSDLVSELDDFLLIVLQHYVSTGQVPIVVGGGHNNAFSLIQFSAQRYEDRINVINLDPHADYRALEGRHSGNSFSYAYKHGFLANYAVLGLHQRYNSEFILTQLKAHQHIFSYYEDYLDGKRDLITDVEKAMEAHHNQLVGVELDMDAIAYMPSSACSPSGFQLDDARKFIRTLAQYNKIAYLHLPEAAPRTEQEEAIVGKALAYLVSDFIQVHSKL